MGLNDTFGWFKYTDDLGKVYVIKLTTALGADLGFPTAAGPPGPSTGQAWPFHEKHMRHVDAYYLNGARKVYGRFPVPTLTSPNYVAAAKFNHKGHQWTVEGTTGEHKDGRNEPPQA